MHHIDYCRVMTDLHNEERRLKNMEELERKAEKIISESVDEIVLDSNAEEAISAIRSSSEEFEDFMMFEDIDVNIDSVTNIVAFARAAQAFKTSIIDKVRESVEHKKQNIIDGLDNEL